jgi:hypothetical protein
MLQRARCRMREMRAAVIDDIAVDALTRESNELLARFLRSRQSNRSHPGRRAETLIVSL